MRALHERNADKLAKIMRVIGWPSAARVGTEASEAAWLIAQHAISRPDIMRAARDALRKEADAGRASKAGLAYLEDRIAVFEGRAQRYGTQFNWDDHGEMSPMPIEDAGQVDARRATVGLGPLADHIAKARAGVAKDGETGPRDLKAHRRAAVAFAVEVGWRSALTDTPRPREREREQT
jgi:hypothetical protein